MQNQNNLNLAKQYFSLKEYKKAIEYSKKGYEEFYDADCLLLLANIYFEMNKYSLAIKYYKLYEENGGNSTSSEKETIGDKFYNAEAYTEAIYWYNEVYNVKPSYEILLKLAKCYFYNDDYQKGAEICKNIQSECSDEMKFKIADMYFQTANFESSIEIYKQMSDADNFKAKLKLAETYYTLERYEEAIDVYRECLDTEDSAQIKYYLGECYYYAYGQDNTFSNAVYWYSYAFEQGYLDGLYKMGLCYQYGKGVETDVEKAVKCYQKAALSSDAKAMCKLGNLYKKGIWFKKDHKIATEYYTKAYNMKNPDATYNLALCYYFGEGVSKDKQKADILFKEAVILGSLKAVEAIDMIENNIIDEGQ